MLFCPQSRHWWTTGEWLLRPAVIQAERSERPLQIAAQSGRALMRIFADAEMQMVKSTSCVVNRIADLVCNHSKALTGYDPIVDIAAGHRRIDVKIGDEIVLS